MSLFAKKPIEFFSQAEKDTVLLAIREAEAATSGEVRVFVESRCKYVDPVDQAREIFAQLKMEATEQRNGVLVYVAMKDRQLAVWGDAGIHEKVGDEFWEQEVKKILSHFRRDDYAGGIADIVRAIGRSLSHYFPAVAGDKNELPDDIVFGK